MSRVHAPEHPDSHRAPSQEAKASTSEAAR
jgi:hypothetical protein